MFGRLLVLAAGLLVFWAETSLVAQDPSAGSTRIEQAKSVSAAISPQIQTVAGPPKPIPQDTRVLFITAPDCTRCQQELAKLSRPGGDFEALRQRGWKIGPGPENHIQIVDRDEVADLVRELNVREFPTVACVSEGKIIRAFKDGCTTPLDSWTFGWLFKGRNERPQTAVAEPARVASTGSYRLRGNHWSVDGDWNPSFATMVSHLRSPNHAYGIASNWRIENWSLEELRSLHDDLHEREMSYTSTSRSSGSTSLWPQKHSASSKIFGK